MMRTSMSLMGVFVVALGAAASCGNDEAAFLATGASSGGSGSGASGGSECSMDRDCKSDDEVCEEGRCLPSHCVDGQKNGDESDIDCGGPCLACDNGGACSAPGDCASKFCDGGVCAACTENQNCGAATFCESGVCVGKLALSEPCENGAECASGFCPDADGVCCDQRCDNPCEACVTEKTGLEPGICAPVSADTDPDSECADEGVASCGANGTGCNGDALAPGCHLYAAGTECAAASCSDGSFSAATSCDGAGNCAMPSPQSCTPYACNAQADACMTACQGDTDCDGQYFCSSNVCVPKKQNGDGCATGNQCQSGFCPAQDLVCCDAACSGTCEACLASKTGASNGSCGMVADNTDPDSECTLVTAPDCNGNGACSL